jgi:hypothetical protein
MVNKSILYRIGGGKKIFDDSLNFDIFISAFNLSERVTHTFDRVKATNKYWIIHNEYCFNANELPSTAPILTSSADQEADFIIEILEQMPQSVDAETMICVDITGFMRPHLLFLIKYAKLNGWKNLHLVYTEPSHYSRRSETVFSSNVIEVRQINGYEGTHAVDTTSDLLIIGAGYDHDLVSQVIAVKSNARLIQLLSLPSLSADMYQESLLRLQRVADVPHRLPDDQQAYASANDPFSTYIVLEETLRRIKERVGRMGNIYLSPLATKPQAVGFALYYLDYLDEEAASIVFPLAKTYSKETSTGVGRAWIYKLSFRDTII